MSRGQNYNHNNQNGQNTSQNTSQNTGRNVQNSQNLQNSQNAQNYSVDIESQRKIAEFKKARARRYSYIRMEQGERRRFRFFPSESDIEIKNFNGVSSERIAHKVVDLDDEVGAKKTLSLTFRQSKPVEDWLEKGHTELELIQTGQGFDLKYLVSPLR